MNADLMVAMRRQRKHRKSAWYPAPQPAQPKGTKR